MYSEKELRELVKEIENGKTFSDLDINERVFIITRLLYNTTNLIAEYMVDSEEDKKYTKQLFEALNILIKIEKGE